MEFRHLGLSDLPSYFACRQRALETVPTAFLITSQESAVQGDGHFCELFTKNEDANVIFAAVDDGVVVATVGVMQEKRTRIRHQAHIWGMFVDEKYRGLGLGKKILDMAIQHTREKLSEVKVLVLTVESQNQSARRLYESRGFVCWGTMPMAMMWDGKMYGDDHMMLAL